MNRAAVKEFRQGVGRARALLRQVFGHWPGVPVAWDRTGITWHSRCSKGMPCAAITIDGERLREMERAISRLSHEHRPHLAKLLPQPDDWLNRAANCLELLKEFLYKPPAAQPVLAETVEKMALAARWRHRIIDLAKTWPPLHELLWNLAFLELTDQSLVSFSYLTWIEAHAESLSRLMERSDGVTIAELLTRVGPAIDERWLACIFEILSEPHLSAHPAGNPFVLADELAQAIRDELRGVSVTIPSRSDAPTLGNHLLVHLQSLVSLKPAAIAKITAFLGSLVKDDVSQMLVGLQTQAHREERRLLKELVRLQQIGAVAYVELVGKSNALTSAHVKTSQRETSQSYLYLLDFIEWLPKTNRDTQFLPTVARFFDHARELPIACRIHLAEEWRAEGWSPISKRLSAMNALVGRRGMHPKLLRHWQRRIMPSVSAERMYADLIVCGARHDGGHSWSRILKLLERLVYDDRESLTEASATAMVKLATATSSIEQALRYWDKLDPQVIASGYVASLTEALWFSSNVDEIRMLLTWFNIYPYIVGQIHEIRSSSPRPQFLELLRRLIAKRDLAAIDRWRGHLSLEDSSTSNSLCDNNVANHDWIQRYPFAFHTVLQRLIASCPDAERIASSVIDKELPSDAKLASEVAGLERLLADRVWSGTQKSERLERIAQRIANLNARLAQPRELTPARTAHLIEKLDNRIDAEMLAELARQSQRVLESRLGALNIDGLRERLALSPYDGILPALRKLERKQQELAWRALGSSWDNSLKLIAEPANQQFIHAMTQMGVRMAPWLSSTLSLDGVRADGTPYRVAFTQDPLDILLMGHHFDTCLALDGVNFFSTVSNLVDANKRVLYAKTDAGQVVGRCLFGLTTQGKLQTFYRYQHCHEDGFALLVNRFAEQLVAEMGTTQTESGQVTCLVAARWYDDGCEPLMDSPRGKSQRLTAMFNEDLETDRLTLARRLFESDEELIRSARVMDDCHLFENDRFARSLFPVLVSQRQVPLSLQLRMAASVWESGNRELARQVFDGWLDREIIRSLGKGTLGYLIEQKGFVDMMVERDVNLATRLLRRSRPKYVLSDEQEEHEMRKYMRDEIARARRARQAELRTK